MKLYVDGIGLFAPGLHGWADLAAILRGERRYEGGELPAFDHAVLPATERRRAGKSIKLAVDLAGQAVRAAGIDPTEPAIVFASTTGDTEVLTDICAALATEDRMISPMRFHNSVHNAASGYWTIAVGSRQPANAIALHERTAAAGLLEAAVQVVAEGIPVLLAVYDIPFPPPLNAAEPIATVFGASLLLRPEPTTHTLAELTIERTKEDGGAADTMHDPELETLRRGVPAARILPLLQALAGDSGTTVTLDYLAGQCVRIAVMPVRTAAHNNPNNQANQTPEAQP
ncbi:hypothetical protein A9404_12220 [Halothiobacillus diazotrophicus]|uniref:Beta-ketoacyl synthase-like N-terminal domain-containing protein n=1 Tax=Halothiobacillus diazotrophicus TaxID=1860122 RepID=A0A191ZJM6_9GAMM|nr:beta-ketoacyl synthase chain length factor [Halothiobacillus diazotrophicus]ANJ68038.1 hypothetical protein A9404_12220 [Halothiobacillus diazotrophicus]